MLNGYYEVVCKLYFSIYYFGIHLFFFFNLFAYRNVECLKLLLNSGADLNKKDNFGR